jgi:hypothetical protein
MTFEELKNALSQRGYSYLSQEQLGHYINRARARIDGLHRWPYRLTTTTSIASITDMGQVQSVRNDTQDVPLEEMGYQDLFDLYDLTDTGSPSYWYRTTTGVATYPVTTNTITVRYWKRTPVLTETDTPLMPADYHLLIVSTAQEMVERDRGNAAAADSLKADNQMQLAEMVEDLLPQSEPLLMRVTGASEDW